MSIIPGYYRCCTPFDPDPDDKDGRKFKVNSVLCIVNAEGHFPSYKERCTYIISPEELAAHFSNLTEEAGIRLRNQEILSLQTDISRVSAQAVTAQQSISTNQERLITASEEQVESFEGALVAPTPERMHVLKQGMADAKLTVSSLASQLRNTQTKLKILLQEQSQLAESKLDELTTLMEKMSEVILRINLYLGRNEEITAIRTGQTADPATPICFRQRRLFMDEECAINPKEGGVDIHTLEDFDKWLCEEDNLQQILPEPKGVVALQVRRKKKNYTPDSLLNFALNEGNFTTYFLIRNGENLWRICNDVSVGNNLFPTSSEYDKYFKCSFSGQPLTPGSSQYYRAMDKADKARGSFMRILLLLQGLLDRTRVFQPLEDINHRVSLSDPATWGESVRFIYDNENLLQEARPTFRNWLLGINSKLNPGMRVCGEFTSYAVKQYVKDDERKGRKYVSNPNDKTLYPMYQQQGDWFIRYQPNELYGDATTRTRYQIYPSDPFILNYDAATVDDLNFYLHDRASRHDYLDLIPLLRTCLKLKATETHEEAPFIDLILNKALPILPDLSHAKVQEICGWWKFKNKEHRPLSVDNAKAYRMIMEEINLDAQRATEYAALGTQIDLTSANLHTHINTDGVLLFAHKKGREFIALRSASTFTSFIHEETYHLYKGKGLQLKSTKKWQMADKRYLRWRVIFEETAWEDWPKHLYSKHYLTDLEAEVVSQQIRDQWPTTMSILWKGEAVFHAYLAAEFEGPTGNLTDDRPYPPQEGHHSVAWIRNSDNSITIQRAFANSRPALCLDSPFRNVKHSWLWESQPAMVLWSDPQALARHTANHQTAIKAQELYRDRDNLSMRLAKQVVDYLEAEEREVRLKAFSEEGGHPDFFDDHLRTLPNTSFPHIRDICPSIEAKIDDFKGVLPPEFPLSTLLQAPSDTYTIKSTTARKKLEWVVPTTIIITCP
jgi:hypothetical protein